IFYEQLSTHHQLPTSSQPSLESLINLFQDPVKDGHEVVGIFLSSLMSGTFSTAQLAKNMVLEEFPQAKIELVDSRTNCMEMGFVVLAAARNALAGKSMEEVLQSAHETMKCTRFIFAPYTLEFLKKGGRIGNASSLLADVLKIKPVLTVVDGVTTTLSKIRTHKKALEYIAGVFEKDVKDHGLSDAMVHHIHCLEQGVAFSKSLVHITKKVMPVITIGAVIGTHVGPGTIGIAYCTKEPLRP
ncbi:MAG: DegV family protein, partial [Vallitaleaceae bacterium]|nr:DegV family protein [Vallitaleaceae bacterium]